MKFNKKYYKEVKAQIHANVFNYGWSPSIYLDMLPELEEKEDFEACQAIKDELLLYVEVITNKQILKIV